MKIIQGTSRHQMQFSSLDNMIAADNTVRILDVFADKLDIIQLGITPHNNKQQAHPGGAPRFDNKLLLKLYLYGYLNKIRSSQAAC
jgi:transposase